MIEQILRRTENFVCKDLGDDPTGHDWHHADRVRRNALSIYRSEKTGDPFIIEMASLLHDIPDEKLNENAETGEAKLDRFLKSLSLPENEMNHIKQIIDSISYKGGEKMELASIEAKIVQDADRLDAIGAIGIARVFAYGGKKGQTIYDPVIPIRDEMSREDYRTGKSSSINHFYEKLLKLKDLMNTQTAKAMAESRHQIMEAFLIEFFHEWNGQEL